MTGIYEKEGAERLVHQDSLALSVGGEKQKLVNEGRILLELELRCLAAHLSHLQCNTTVHRFRVQGLGLQCNTTVHRFTRHTALGLVFQATGGQGGAECERDLRPS